MTDRTVRTRFEAITGQYQAAMAEMAASTKGVALTMDSVAAASKGSFKSIGMDMAGLGSSGLFAAAGVAVAGAAVAKLAHDGVNAYVGLASEIGAYKRIAGGTAEDSSRMVAAFHAVGIESSAGATAVFRLSQNLARNSQELTAAGVVVARDKAGHVDLNKTLLSLSDAYRNMQDPQQRNVLMMQALSRGAIALAPLLARSRDEIKGFWDEAAKHGLIFSQQDLDQVRAYKLSVHELGDTWKGFEVQVGRAVVPALTQGLTALSEGATAAGANVAKAGIPFGGFGRLLGGLAKDSFPEVAIATDLLRGHFVGAATDLIPYGNTLHNLFFHHNAAAEAAKKHAQAEGEAQLAIARVSEVTGVSVPRLKELERTLGLDLATGGQKAADALQAAADKINAAVTPTERLAAVTGVLTDSYATGAEKVKAFKDALDAVLGSELDSQQASLNLRQSVQGLANDFAAGQLKGETFAEFQNRLQGQLITVVRNIEAVGSALVANGQLRPEDQVGFLTSALQRVGDQFPTLRGQIAGYVGDLGKIPVAVATTLNVNTAQAEANIAKVVAGLTHAQTLAVSNFLSAAHGGGDQTAANAFIQQTVAANATAAQAASAAAAAQVNALFGPAPVGHPGGGDDPKRDADAVASYLKSLYDRRNQITDNMFKAGKISLASYDRSLDEQLSHETEYTDEWVALQQKKKDAAKSIADYLKSLYDTQQRMIDNEYTVGAVSKDAYLKVLDERLAGLKKYSDEWTQVWQQIQQIRGDALGAQLDMIRAFDQGQSFQAAWDAAAGQRRMSAPLQQAVGGHLSPATAGGTTTIYNTREFSPTLNAYGSDAMAATTTNNQKLRDLAASMA